MLNKYLFVMSKYMFVFSCIGQFSILYSSFQFINYFALLLTLHVIISWWIVLFKLLVNCINLPSLNIQCSIQYKIMNITFLGAVSI